MIKLEADGDRHSAAGATQSSTDVSIVNPYTGGSSGMVGLGVVMLLSAIVSIALIPEKHSKK